MKTAVDRVGQFAYREKPNEFKLFTLSHCRVGVRGSSNSVGQWTSYIELHP